METIPEIETEKYWNIDWDSIRLMEKSVVLWNYARMQLYFQGNPNWSNSDTIAWQKNKMRTQESIYIVQRHELALRKGLQYGLPVCGATICQDYPLLWKWLKNNVKLHSNGQNYYLDLKYRGTEIPAFECQIVEIRCPWDNPKT